MSFHDSNNFQIPNSLAVLVICLKKSKRKNDDFDLFCVRWTSCDVPAFLASTQQGVGSICKIGSQFLISVCQRRGGPPKVAALDHVRAPARDESF
jgi:hypothetical protein